MPAVRRQVRGAKDREIEVKDIKNFNSVTGKGVKAEVEGKEVLVGSRKLMGANNIDTSDFEEELKRLENEAKTAMLAAADGKMLGIVVVADALKEDSVQALTNANLLRRKNVQADYK